MSHNLLTVLQMSAKMLKLAQNMKTMVRNFEIKWHSETGNSAKHEKINLKNR